MASLNGRERPSPSHNTGENSNLPQPHSLIQHSTDLVWIGEWLPSIFITQTIKCFRSWWVLGQSEVEIKGGNYKVKRWRIKLLVARKGRKSPYLFDFVCFIGLFFWSFPLYSYTILEIVNRRMYYFRVGLDQERDGEEEMMLKQKEG